MSVPLRPVGAGLLALGVVFAGIGVVGGGDDVVSTGSASTGSGSTGSASTSSSAPPSVTTTAATTTSAPAPSSPAPSSPAASPTTATPAPVPTPEPAPPTVAPAPEATEDEATVAGPRDTTEVVVLNNSTVAGLAARAAADVESDGWTVVEVGNFTGRIPTTTVYYRPGTGEESAAAELARVLDARTLPRYEGLPRTAAGIVLVVTPDYAG